MIKDGKGGAKTLTGLKFESRVSLKDIFLSLPDFDVKEDIIYFKDKKVAQLFQKHKLYKNFLESKINYSDFISKKLLPDEAIYVFKTKTMFIVEMKFQEVAGSVDEKLQTCDFKNKQYNKLLSNLGIKAKYVYVLNDWFKKKEYSDVLNYISSVNCYYFFNVLPLEFLGL
ncbi:MAG: hypothetical protein KKA51_06365 [Nanoarchaeota archaeon]|nr:hypothetical protein [Nanoarchaeota archaeon]